MNNLFPFLVLFCFITLQRMVELFIAKRNERWMKQKGAIEFGEKHYKYMVSMHVLFFISFFVEKIGLNRLISPMWFLLLLVFIVAQIVRIWVIASLGEYWNTKILVLANSKVIKKGPYRYIKHPNYFVVATELLVVPLLFSCYITAVLFTLLNALIISIRISEEERALQNLTEYITAFENCNRFLPRVVK